MTPDPMVIDRQYLHATAGIVFEAAVSTDAPIYESPHRSQPVAITRVYVRKDEEGNVSLEWWGYAVKKDGTIGNARRSGRFYNDRFYNDFPDWAQALVNRVPRPRVTLEGEPSNG